MRNISSVRFHHLFVLLATTACHLTSPGETAPDAGVVAPEPDASLPADAGSGSAVGSDGGITTRSCDYTEQRDLTNDYLEGGPDYAIEDTGISFTGGTKTICGTVNNGHFDDYYYSVDIDTYQVTLPSSRDLLVSIDGDTADMGAISSVQVWAYNATTGDSFGEYFYGDHGVMAAHLTAGTWQFSMEAYDNQDALASASYYMTIKQDNPVQRCARVTAPASYTEALDGASSIGNDGVNVDFDATPEMWMAAAPEPSGVTMSGGTRYRVHGTSAAVALNGSYYDRDAYLVTTDATTNQLSIRLNWGGQSDLDYLVFPASTTFPIGFAWQSKLGEDEFATFSVLPSSQYWVWVGASSNTDPTTLPADYDASLCAETYAP
jgi:hypothetical protein